MTKNKFIALLLKFYSGSQTQSEEKELLQSDEVDTFLKHQWDNPEEMQSKASEPDFDKIFQTIQEKTAPVAPKRSISFMRIAATILILAGLAALLYYYNTPDFQKNQNVYQTASAEVRSFDLPDGSKVWLNQNSKLSYKNSFELGRVVTLTTGEAFFEVRKNGEPFKVLAGKVTVTVMGTSFSVCNNTEKQKVETILRDGIVRWENGQQEALMQPDSRILFEEATNTFSTESVNAHELLLWKDPKISFNNDKLSDIASKLSDRYGIPFTVTDSAAAKLRFTFSLTTEKLESVLDLLGQLAPINCQQKDNAVFISHQESH